MRGTALQKAMALATIAFVLAGQAAFAIHQGANEAGKLLPYARKMSHPLDEPVNAACPDGSFLMNLGPTGIRADIRPEYAKEFKVKFVFKGSPAAGKIEVGDHIYGAGGKEFKNPHGFHRKKGGRGWPGPPFELAHAIEDAQGKDGKLELMVKKANGSKTRVTVQIKPVGRFSPTWPWNCPRSDQLLKDLLDFMLDEGNINRMKRHHHIQALLAVLASGDKRAMPLVKSAAESYMKSKPDFKSGGMGQTWMTGYKGILLGEYYNLTKDSGVKAAAKNYAPFYEYAQFGNGSYGHRSAISFIATGRKPYASMAAAGGICMLAQSTFKQNGLDYSEVAYQRGHLGHLRSAGKNSGGGIAYGFSGETKYVPTDHAVLKLESMSGVKEPKPRPWWPELGGKGLYSESTLADCGKYTVEWPHPKDHRWRNGCIDWLKTEKDTVKIKWSGSGNTVTAYRHVPTPPIKEPTSPYNTTPNGAGHQAGSAPGALAHFIGNKGNKSWEYLGRHMANGCALSPKMLWDGHADAVIHSFFGALAAFRADEKNLRSWLDYTKTWIILSETHEPRAKGGLVDQPFGCQRNATCSVACGRTAYTHVAIAILSVPKRKILLTGADYEQPAPPTTAKAHSYAGSSSSSSATSRPARVVPKLREARTLSAKNRTTLNNSLLKTLVKLSDAKLLKPMPIRISRTSALVALMKASSDGTLTFAPVAKTIDRNGNVDYTPPSSSRTADFNWNDLASADRASLAMLVAKLKPDSSDAQALVGVYLEGFGRVREADAYFKKAGPASTKKLSKLFD